MDPITYSFLMIASTAPKITQFFLQRNENKKNQKEARIIGEQNRQDTLSYNSRINELNTQSANLADKKLSNANFLNKEANRVQIQDMKNTKYQLDKKSNLGVADQLGFNKNTGLLKSRILGNF